LAILNREGILLMFSQTGAEREPSVQIVDVGLRDGFQPIVPFIPTTQKLAILNRLHAAGLRRVEATAFVSEKAVPQLSDAAELLAAVQALPGMDAQVLVPTARHAERALAAGADHIAFVLSVSEKHNLANVRRTRWESVAEYARVVAALPPGTRVRLNIATAFDCPFDGPVSPWETLALVDDLIDIAPDAEICPCDTTGRVTPDRVGALFRNAKARFPEARRWAFHGHDTYGLGVANVMAAWIAGVGVIDASVGGLGGCPFAPGATGNVATEDIVWMFEAMKVSTGVALDRLVEVAGTVAALPGASVGGRVRDALAAASRRRASAPAAV
jgi:hydroxymethylglutaryl-CoA lyase